MLTADEKRFIKYWEDQREGGRTQYYLLYILAGTFIATIVITFVTLMFIPLPLSQILGWVVFTSAAVVTIATVDSWNRNEAKFKAIIRREVDDAKQKASQENDSAAPASE